MFEKPCDGRLLLGNLSRVHRFVIRTVGKARWQNSYVVVGGNDDFIDAVKGDDAVQVFAVRDIDQGLLGLLAAGQCVINYPYSLLRRDRLPKQISIQFGL